ncbi:MAG: hypothetical protein AUK63_1440 [bacterium P3]|nr:MAG: hypothetical protein AUK63_1440 [bacterium P3]KWW40067.1 MAG: hypothetical protein F083_1789 [bacterium F083]
MKQSIYLLTTALLAASLFTACKNDEEDYTSVPEGVNEEVYAGGLLGTTFNQSASAYEDPTPATEQAGLATAFKYGEFFFEHTITQSNPPFNGLGPLYVRSSCENCHPGYGHGRRMERYRADDWGNGYLLVVYNKNTDAYETSVAGMPQTKAVAPFKPSIDETKIDIQWLPYTDEWGNRFPDGEGYDLIYPEVIIPQDAFYAPFSSGTSYSDLAFRLETTIGIYGTGLLDAIPDDSLKAQYQREYDAGANLNPAIWGGSDWASLYGSTSHPKRFTYALSRGPLQDAAGANAIWNIPNVTRSDRRSHYLSLNKSIYATAASQDPDVQADFYRYFPEWNKTGNPQTDIYNYLMCDTLPIEMSDQDYVNFMVWHRGLAVPAARDLDDATVQRGRTLFREIGCATCHRPSWTTGADNFTDPNGFFRDGDSRLPRYPYQKIWPYSDMVQHRLFMKNDIRTGWCRTTPLWGRGLAPICSGHADRLHDCRARNVIEAIMWHGSAQSDARRSVEKFRQLSKADRDAVVKFINAI